MKFTFAHNNISAFNLDKSIQFYKDNLGLDVVRSKEAEDGSYKIAFLGDGTSVHKLELTWYRDWKEPYKLGDNEIHLAFIVDDYDAAYELHKKNGCICYENTKMGLYFISDPDGFWIEIIPKKSLIKVKKMKDISIWYLYNSGYALKTGKKLLIFDYYNDTPAPSENSLHKSNAADSSTGLDRGVIRRADLEGLDVYVFVSHRHHDHHNKVIYDWKQKNPDLNISYIISDDVEEILVDDYLICAPNKDYSFEDLEIKTLKSNDEGISFYVKVNGLSIFHSGDLNWWRWEGEPDEWNDSIESSYKNELEHLKGLPIDFAFIPVDPRLEANYSLSLKYFMSHIMPSDCTVFPMHFADNYSIFKQLKEDEIFDETIIQEINHRGQKFEYSK